MAKSRANNISGEGGDASAGSAAVALPSPANGAVVERLLVRYQVSIRRRMPILLLSLTTTLLLTLIFEPFDCWWLAWFAMVPWLVAIATARRWGWMLFCSWLAGFTFFAGNLYWLLACGYPGPPLGVMLMALAELALSAYMGCYFLLFAYVIGGVLRRWGPESFANARTATRGPDPAESDEANSPRRPSGLMMVYLAPIAWVGTEILRGYVLSGFPWFLLGHSLYRQITLIQIADLGGAYAVTLLLAAVNGLIADGLLQPLFLPTRKGPRPNYQVSAATLAILGLVLMTIAYGRYRVDQIDLSQRPGPRVTALQLHIPIRLAGDGSDDLLGRFDSLMEGFRQAAAMNPRPDLIASPETMIPAVINDEWLGEIQKWMRRNDVKPTEFIKAGLKEDSSLRDLARSRHVALLVGATSLVPAPSDWMEKLDPPSIDLNGEPVGAPGYDNPQLVRYNSAVLYQPEFAATQPAGETTTRPGLAGVPRKSRYDKHHLVPFGEIIPFRRDWPAAFRFIRSLTPMSLLSAGEDLRPLKLKKSDGQGEYSFAAPICYEDVIPQAIRRLVYDSAGRKQVDFLVNISNDGWFTGTPEVWQHRASAAFRCIENRVPMARSVNGGCSGFFNSIGQSMGVMPPGKKGCLPPTMLPLDPRRTIYGRIGDWPGFVCAALLFAGMFVVFVRRRRAKHAAKPPARPASGTRRR